MGIFQKKSIKQQENANIKTNAYDSTGKIDPFEDPFKNRSHVFAKKSKKKFKFASYI